MPLVSVIMAYHRVTPFLPLAVASILGQSLTDLELIVTDNGTGQGLEPLGAGAKDPRVRLVSHPTNLGIPAAHNAAIRVATGEFIAFSDYDDISLPTRLEKQVMALREDAALGLVSSRAQSINANGAVIGPEFALDSARDQRVFTNYTVPAPSPSYTGRRELFLRHPYRLEFPVAGDYDFIARVADATKIAGVPEILFQYRHHGTQATWQNLASQTLSACMIRLLTARRRAGRTEDLPGLARELSGWIAEPPALGAIYAVFARRCVAEGFPLLAVYHARKLLSQCRGISALNTAVSTLLAAMRQDPRQAATLMRMFLTGPLRTHGLRPA